MKLAGTNSDQARVDRVPTALKAMKHTVPVAPQA